MVESHEQFLRNKADQMAPSGLGGAGYALAPSNGPRLRQAADEIARLREKITELNGECEATMDEIGHLRAENERLRGALAIFTEFFEVKDGPRKSANQYGHVELWHRNPGMLLAQAENSYSIACMNHMRFALEQAREALTNGHSSEPQK